MAQLGLEARLSDRQSGDLSSTPLLPLEELKSERFSPPTGFVAKPAT